jgi:hypothetical protein
MIRRAPGAFGAAVLAAALTAPALADAPRRVIAVDDGETLAARAALETIEEGEIVWLDLAFAPGETCEEGPRWEGETSDGVTGLPAGGDHHLIAELRAGAPDAFPFNAVTCEYTGEAGAPWRLRVRGVYAAHSLSVPTARVLRLNPLRLDPATESALARGGAHDD